MRRPSGIEVANLLPDLRTGYSIPPHAPYESFWSWIQKFAYQNQTSIDVIRDLLGVQATGNRAGTSDLRAPAGWDLNRLQVLWQRPAGEGFVVDYLGATSPGVWRTMAWNHLRYCPACAEFGYHTPLFQVRGIGHCPMHEFPLAERCPRCDQLMPYRATPNTLWTPYGCPTCGHPLWPTMTEVGQPNVDASPIMDAVWRWLQEASAKQWGMEEELLARWQVESLQSSDGGGGMRTGLVSYWYQVHPPPVRGIVVDCGRTAQVFEWGGERPANSYVMDDGPAARQDALRTLYKAYARHWRRELRHHRSCIRSVIRHVLIVPTSACDWYTTESLCPWAFAYILWRMYWDGIDKPGQLDRRPARRSRHQPKNPGPAAVFTNGYWGMLATDSDRGIASARWLAEHETVLLFSSMRGEWETVGQVMANTGEMVWDPHLISEGSPVVAINETGRDPIRFYSWPPTRSHLKTGRDDSRNHRQTVRAQSLRVSEVMRGRMLSHVNRALQTRET